MSSKITLFCRCSVIVLSLISAACSFRVTPVASMNVSPTEAPPVASTNISPTEASLVASTNVSPTETPPVASTNVSPTETPPVASTNVSPTETPPADGVVASSLATYTNVEYGFAFDYPAQVEVRVEEKPFQLLVYTESADPFYIRATRDFLPGDVTYFLDTSSTGELVYGPYVWLTYYLPDGYADATGVSQPIYALQMKAEDVLYSVVFYNQDSLTEAQGQVLSTFRLLE